MARPDDDAGSSDDGSDDAFLREVARVDDSSPDAAERLPGARVGRFVVKGELGRGGMGIVYRAQDEGLGRAVALKVLPPHKEGHPERRARFLREARSAGSIVHPNVATVYEIGESDTSLYIAMELIAGESLRARFAARRPLPVDEVLRIAKGMARGLAAAHERGIVHRDLKPENVIVDAKGEPKILDFGLAKLRDAQDTPREVLEQQSTDAQSTEEGRVLGTPAYMSPEQAAGKRVDARSDLFALGVVLYEALTGGRPFVGDTSFETIAAVLRDDPTLLGVVNPEAPPELAALVMRCLAKAPDDRPSSAAALLEALEQLPAASTRAPAHAPNTRARAPLIGWVTASVLAIVAIGYVWRSQPATVSPVPISAQQGPSGGTVADLPSRPAPPAGSATAAADASAPPAASTIASAALAPSPSHAVAVHEKPTRVATPPVASSAAVAAKPRPRDPLSEQD